MKPFLVELDDSAAASIKRLPEAARIAVLKYLHVVASHAAESPPGEPVERMAEVATFLVRCRIDPRARSVRVISPLD